VIKRWDLEPDWKYSVDRVTDDVDRIVELDREVRKELMKYSSEELIKKPLSRGLLPEALRRLVGRPVIVKSYTLREALSEKHWYIRRSILKVEVNDKEQGGQGGAGAELALQDVRDSWQDARREDV